MRLVTIPATGETFDLDRPGAVVAWNRALNRRYAMDNLAEHPRALVRRIEARRRARIAALVPPFQRALDLGAEDGSLAAAWRHRGEEVFLLDLDPSMLRRTSSGEAGNAIAGDALHLPFRAGAFDLVVMSAVLEHVLEPSLAIAEAARVLAPGGRMVAYVPWDRAVVGAKRWARRLGFGLGRLHDGVAPGHLRIFDRARLVRLFAPHTVAPRVRLDPLSFGYYIEARV